MLVKSGTGGNRNTTTLWVSTSCYTDSLPIVSEVFFAGVEFDIESNGFQLGAATLLSRHAGEVIEFADRRVGGDFAEAIRNVLRSGGLAGPVDSHDRALASGEVDVACFPARHRNAVWTPADDLTPLQLIDWSGDFVAPGAKSSAGNAVGRIFTNAGLVADETLVSIAIGLMHGGNKLRRLMVPLPEGVPAGRYVHLVRALQIAGITLKLVPVARVAAADGVGAQQPIVVLTHRLDARFLAHVERLKRDMAGLIPVFLALQNDSPITPAGVDIHIREADLPSTLPTRHAEMLGREHNLRQGYLDLVLFALAAAPVLPDYRYLWVLEYDVDFAGNWRDFFARYLDSRIDVIASDIRSRAETPDWHHWRWGAVPSDIPEAQRYRLYSQALRLSRRFLGIYRQEIARPGWRGYYEHTLATVARIHGLSMEDLGGEGRYAAPPERRAHQPSTWRLRPALADQYFHENPAGLAPGLLHHPIKIWTDPPRSMAPEDWYTALETA